MLKLTITSILPLIALASANLFAQEKHTLSGSITDQQTGEKLAGASLTIGGYSEGAVSNSYGYFSIAGSPGPSREITVNYVGYSGLKLSFDFRKDSIVTIQLIPHAIILNSVEIESITDENDFKYEAQRVLLSPAKVKSTASFGGEPDVLKTLQLLPGVQSGNEGTSNFSVRGGSFDQNLILLDEAPVYNPSHALSFFSIFNVDALHSIEFYKSAIPVRYGGRLSSVVDIRMKEGNRKEFKATGSVGTIASKLTLEGPLSKDERLSFLVSGRYSYAGQVVNGIYFLGQQFFGDKTANNSTTNNRINFYDLNGKVNYRLNQRNHFFLSNYSGHDNFYFNHITSGYNLAWGNNTSTFRWNHIYNQKLFSNTTLTYSDYQYTYKLLNNTQYFNWSANLKEHQLKQDYDWFLNENNQISFGFGVQNHLINPGQIRPRSESSVSNFYKLPDKKALGLNLYFGNQQSINSSITLSYGVRYSSFSQYGTRIEYSFADGENPTDSTITSKMKFFHRLDPRVQIKFRSGNNTYSISYDRTTQFFHLLANSSVGLPTDLWWPSSSNIRPQSADLFAGNFERSLGETWGFASSIFYKRIGNVVDFRDNAKLFLNKYMESQLLQGLAQAYGAEFFIEKKKGKLTGSVSYTLSKTYNQIDGVNDGKPYPNRYDKRHNISSTWKLQVSPKLDISANFIVTTGGALTVPTGTFVFDGVPFNYYSKRNGYRLPLYNRLDLALKYQRNKNPDRKFKGYWVLDVYNVYGKKNPFTIYALQTDYGFQATKVKAFYLFKIVPSISYNFTF